MSKLKNNYRITQINDILANIYWYHTFKFSDGLRTQGVYDFNKVIDKYGFGKNLSGKTVLDVGTADGFFAFHCEKLGAKVLAIDVNEHDGKLGFDPSVAKKDRYDKKYCQMVLTNRERKNKNTVYQDMLRLLGIDTLNNFFIIKDLLDSKVEFKYHSVYDLEKLGRKFDVIIVGDLIEHLKSPIVALEQIRKTIKRTAIIILSSPIMLKKEGLLFSGIRKLARFLISNLDISWQFLERLAIDNSSIVSFHGNEAGGSFFHFSEVSFKEALLAAGFKKVTIYSRFSTPNLKTKVQMRRIVYHCYPG